MRLKSQLTTLQRRSPSTDTQEAKGPASTTSWKLSEGWFKEAEVPPNATLGKLFGADMKEARCPANVTS